MHVKKSTMNQLDNEVMLAFSPTPVLLVSGSRDYMWRFTPFTLAVTLVLESKKEFAKANIYAKILGRDIRNSMNRSLGFMVQRRMMFGAVISLVGSLVES